jgi:hypothetical protein
MERRTFLKHLGLVSAALVIPIGRLSSKSFLPEDPAKQWSELIEYARWSASPHNIQPWKVKILSASEAELWYDPARLIPYTDKGSKFMTVALGIFIENISIAAASSGYKLHFTYFENPIDSTKTEFTPFGKMKLEKAEVRNEFDPELIKLRRTSRLHFQSKPIDESVLRELALLASEQGHSFQYSSQEEMVDFVVHLNGQTLFSDLDDDKTRKELDHWLRYSDEDASGKRDGLWYTCMRFPKRLMRSFFHHHGRFEHEPVKTAVNNYYLHSMKGTRTVAWMQGKFETPEECLVIGRMLARFWLLLTKHGAYLHPFGSVITNPKSHALLKDKLNVTESDQQLWMLMRLGYSEEPPRSYRLETSQILIS